MDFPINQQLLEETNKLKEERRVVRERLEKIDGGKAQVSGGVYERVRGDYQKKLQEATAALLAKKSAIDRELATLYEARTKVGENVTQHTDELEELKFRHSLGEFDSAAFNTKSQQITEKLAKFETLLSAVNNNIERYERLFADEPDLLPDGPRPVRDRAAVTVPTEVSVHEALRDELDTPDEHYELASSGGDYFAPNQVAETRVFKPAELEADTQVGPPPTTPAGPVLAIVEGIGAGSVFAVQRETTIGRSKDSHVSLKEAKVSRQHAVIRKEKNDWLVVDLQSSNGVFVNGARVEKVKLASGDHIQIGSFVLEFRTE